MTAATTPLTPAFNSKTLSKAELQAQIIRGLGAHLPSYALLYQTEDTTPYECDGLTAYRQRPLVVALPETEAQIAAVLKTCHALGVPVVAEVARRLAAPLDLLLVRKIGAPWQRELAVAAVVDGDAPEVVIDEGLSAYAGADRVYLERETAAALAAATVMLELLLTKA